MLPSRVQLPPSTPCWLATSPFRTRKKVLHAYTTQFIGQPVPGRVGLRSSQELSLFALDPANTARGCSCLLPSNDRVVPHQPHRTLTRAPMTGMLLDFQMPAGINGIERMPTTNAGSDTLQLNAAPSRLSLFALDPANTARGCRACCLSDDRMVFHTQPHRTFTRANDRHAARLPDARRDQWYRTHADHNAGSDTICS